MGKDIIPLIINDFKKNGPNHWFAALRELTNENPVPEEYWGNMQKMIDIWIDWFEKKGENNAE